MIQIRVVYQAVVQVRINAVILRPVGGMGGYEFCIHLHPDFKAAVAKSDLDQEGCNRVLELMGTEWCQRVGYGGYFDPEHCTHGNSFGDEVRIPSDDARPRWKEHLRVSWGEWGPEHISVPGNACGLDIDRGFGCIFEDGRMLVSHNVDCWQQVCLLLMTFTWFAHTLVMGPYKNYGE